MLTKGLVEVMDVHVAVGNNNIGGGDFSRLSRCICLNHDDAGDDELRMAARAGLILLEKNAALEVDVELLSTELHRYKVQHRELQMEVQTLRDQRKTAVLEVQAAHKEAKALQASFRTERATWHSTEQALTQQLRSLTSELQLARQQTQEVIHPTAHVASIESSNFDDHNLTTSLTEEELATVEDPRVALLQAENDDLHVQVSQVLQELSQLQVSWSQSTYASNQRIQSLEHELHKLTRENKLLKEEQAEERDLIDSLRTMVQTYKKIADARPFGAAASTVGDDSNQDTHDEDRTSLSTCSNETHDLETSMHEDVMALNSALERRVRELEAQVAQTTSDDAKLLEEQLNGTKEALKHTKQQWIAAVTAKKEAQACTAAAHEELARMQEAFQNVQEKLQSSGTKPDDEYVDWMEDSVVHPAPPGDLDSPLIGCLLQHWTSDKELWGDLFRWLQGTIHGHPTHHSVRMDRLSSEVSAGFVQLLVPVLREVHGVHVKVMRRTSVHVLTDLVLSVATESLVGSSIRLESVAPSSPGVLYLVS